MLYLDEESRRFSVTARTERARLSSVNDQMAAEGYTPTILAEGLDKPEAEAMRDRVRADYIRRGYAYQTRPQLS